MKTIERGILDSRGKSSPKYWTAACLIMLLAFLIPIEHKYDKLFRFYSLTLIPEGLQISKGYEKRIYFYISDLIALALTFCGFIWHRIPIRAFFRNLLWVVFLFAVASIAASPFIYYPTAYLHLLHLFTPIALFSFIANVFSNEERRWFVMAVLIALTTAGLIQAAIGIAQYFYQAPLGLGLLGETDQPSMFKMEQPSRWLLDQLLDHPWRSSIIYRASGTFPHANVFGGFMLISLLSTYALAHFRPTKFLRFTLPFQLFAMSLSYSRSALFAWGIATAVWFGMNGLKHRIQKHLAWMIAISAALTGTLLFEQYASRGGVVRASQLSKDADQIRKIHQKTALAIMKDYPLTGLGFSQFSERAQKYFQSDVTPYVRTTAPHNVFLFLACETGLISACALIGFIGILLRSFFQSSFTIESTTFASLLIGFVFIGLCDFYPILFQQGKLMFFLITSLLAVSIRTGSN